LPSLDFSKLFRQMNEAPDVLHHRLDQLRLLAMETTNPLAERLVRDMIAELEDRLRADPKRASGR
jgi:cytochrome c-type biogenesis protein CcmH/NrfG